jgi:Pyruvate/2-oxoacid:ferredoxin oxidoreductase gamma subunit
VGLVALAAISSGLYAAQRDDFPITVMSGHSVSELILGPTSIDYPGVLRPDLLVILTDDGFAKAKRFLARLEPQDRVVVLPDFAEVVTDAAVEVVDPKALPQRVGKAELALVATVAALEPTGLLSRAALEAAAKARPAFADKNLRAIALGYELAEQLRYAR